ncbi:hypothetical protein LAZ67_8003548 [Cordylochernes scorpioides]|uniref:Uncharacterized protein n=1 Tax=Cordylochernes scorpioides TaxID=51811 RepID=A0ABY6KUD9_9ARAC|nr:hypothetical protein LAZ67_8003548 [Cordylochernes scorpioides]
MTKCRRRRTTGYEDRTRLGTTVVSKNCYNGTKNVWTEMEGIIDRASILQAAQNPTACRSDACPVSTESTVHRRVSELKSHLRTNDEEETKTKTIPRQVQYTVNNEDKTKAKTMKRTRQRQEQDNALDEDMTPR